MQPLSSLSIIIMVVIAFAKSFRSTVNHNPIRLHIIQRGRIRNCSVTFSFVAGRERCSVLPSPAHSSGAVTLCRSNLHRHWTQTTHTQLMTFCMHWQLATFAHFCCCFRSHLPSSFSFFFFCGECEGNSIYRGAKLMFRTQNKADESWKCW